MRSRKRPTREYTQREKDCSDYKRKGHSESSATPRRCYSTFVGRGVPLCATRIGLQSKDKEVETVSISHFISHQHKVFQKSTPTEASSNPGAALEQVEPMADRERRQQRRASARLHDLDLSVFVFYSQRCG